MARERIPLTGEEEHDDHVVPDTDHLKDRMDKSQMPGPDEDRRQSGQDRQRGARQERTGDQRREREPRSRQASRGREQGPAPSRQQQEEAGRGQREQQQGQQRAGQESGRQDRRHGDRGDRRAQRGTRSGRKDIEEKAVRMLVDTLREKGVSEEFIENNREKIREKALQQLYGDRRTSRGRDQRRR